MNTIVGIRTERKPAYYEIITPEIAKVIMENNSGNRKISTPKVLEYQNQMSNGLYKEGTAEPLKISNKGRLLDGQHRLTALIKAGVTLEFLVARNLDESIFDVLDTGKSRGASDALSIADAPNSTTCASIIKLYLSTNKSVSAKYKFSNSEIVNEYNSSRVKYDEMVNRALRLKNTGNVFTATTIGGLMLAFMDKNEDDARSFFDQLCRVKPLENTTIDALFMMFVKDASSTKKMMPQQKITNIITAWNAFRLGKNLKIIKYFESDGYPTII